MMNLSIRLRQRIQKVSAHTKVISTQDVTREQERPF